MSLVGASIGATASLYFLSDLLSFLDWTDALARMARILALTFCRYPLHLPVWLSVTMSCHQT